MFASLSDLYVLLGWDGLAGKNLLTFPELDYYFHISLAEDVGSEFTMFSSVCHTFYWLCNFTSYCSVSPLFSDSAMLSYFGVTGPKCG